MEDAYKKYGSVFTVPLFHKRMTFLVGPEVSGHFFKVRICRWQVSVENVHAHSCIASENSTPVAQGVP